MELPPARAGVFEDVGFLPDVPEQAGEQRAVESGVTLAVQTTLDRIRRRRRCRFGGKGLSRLLAHGSGLKARPAMISMTWRHGLGLWLDWKQPNTKLALVHDDQRTSQ
jgi:hypothetical protein